MVQAMGVAATHHRQGDLKAAEQACDDILARNPKHPDALTLLAMICHQSGRHDRAVKLCTDALRRDKKRPGTWFVLANAEIAKGRAKEAQRALNALIKLQPGHPAEAQLKAQIQGI
jgi:predicted Zn-dependent protease